MGRPKKPQDSLIRPTSSKQLAVPLLVSTSRGIDTKVQRLAWASIFILCNTTDVKETLLVFNTEISTALNLIALEAFNKERLSRALMYLIADDVTRIAVACKHLTKKGVATAIVKEIHRLLPYQCNGCDAVVQQDRLKKSDIRCLSCGIDACNVRKCEGQVIGRIVNLILLSSALVALVMSRS